MAHAGLAVDLRLAVAALLALPEQPVRVGAVAVEVVRRLALATLLAVLQPARDRAVKICNWCQSEMWTWFHLFAQPERDRAVRDLQLMTVRDVKLLSPIYATQRWCGSAEADIRACPRLRNPALRLIR